MLRGNGGGPPPYAQAANRQWPADTPSRHLWASRPTAPTPARHAQVTDARRPYCGRCSRLECKGPWRICVSATAPRRGHRSYPTPWCESYPLPSPCGAGYSGSSRPEAADRSPNGYRHTLSGTAAGWTAPCGRDFSPQRSVPEWPRGLRSPGRFGCGLSTPASPRPPTAR